MPRSSHANRQVARGNPLHQDAGSGEFACALSRFHVCLHFVDTRARRYGPERRSGTPRDLARRIAALFLRDAGHLSSKHVDFFDSLLVDLVPHADLKERAELAERLSLLGDAPRALVRQMARDNEILIAGGRCCAARM